MKQETLISNTKLKQYKVQITPRSYHYWCERLIIVASLRVSSYKLPYLSNLNFSELWEITSKVRPVEIGGELILPTQTFFQLEMLSFQTVRKREVTST